MNFKTRCAFRILETGSWFWIYKNTNNSVSAIAEVTSSGIRSNIVSLTAVFNKH